MSLQVRRPLIPLAATLCAALGTAACAPPQVLEGGDLPAVKALSDEVDAARVWSYLLELTQRHREDTVLDCSQIPTRELSPEVCHLSNGLSRAWVKSQFQSFDLPVQEDDQDAQGLHTTNIIAELRGVSKPEEIILVGAHFDAFYEGADDNSSGTAGLMELARVLSQHRFARTVRFVGFDLEEFGITGSHRYVNTLAGERVVTTLVLETIGYYSSEEGSQLSLPGLPSPSRGDFLAAIANDESSQPASVLYELSRKLELMDVVPIISPRNGTSSVGEPLTRSDHLPFWFNHRQALFITDTAPFRNPHYHKSTDTADTLDAVKMGQAVRVAAASLAWWAEGPLP